MAFGKTIAKQPGEVIRAYEPQRGPQMLFCSLDYPDIIYGGSRYGGKSFALLLDARNRALRFGKAFRGLLVRRRLTELEDIWAWSKEVMLQSGARYQEQAKTWTWPSGAWLKMSYLENDSDAEQYQGWSLTWLGVDEVGNFPNSRPIDLLWGTLRSPYGIPCVRRMTCNPGGPGHVWVKERYLLSGPFKLFEYAPQPELSPDLKLTGFFIPALLEDNQEALKNSSQQEYEAKLAAATQGSPALYKAWRWGIWDIIAGQYFDNWSPAENGRDREPKDWYPHWIAMDWGFAHDSAILWMWQDDDGGVHVYREWLVRGLSEEKLAEGIIERTDVPPIAFYLSHDAFNKRTAERTIAAQIGDALTAKGFVEPTRAEIRRVSRVAADLRGKNAQPEQATDDELGGWRYVYQQIERRKLTISPTRCPKTIRSLLMLVHDPDDQENVIKVDGDDAADALRYGLYSRKSSGKKPLAVRASEAWKVLTGVETEEDERRISPTSRAMLGDKLQQILGASSQKFGRMRRKSLTTQR